MIYKKMFLFLRISFHILQTEVNAYLHKMLYLKQVAQHMHERKQKNDFKQQVFKKQHFRIGDSRKSKQLP